LLEANPFIESLYLSSPKFLRDKAELQARSATNLHSLSIRDAEISLPEVVDIAACEKLNTVDLTGCEFEESAVPLLLQSKSVETLILDACKPVGNVHGVAFLGVSPQCPVKHLSIDRWEFDDAEWAHFIKLSRLESLRAGQIGDGVRFSESVGKIKCLRELHVRFSSDVLHVNSEFCEAMAMLSSLETLGLSEPQLSPACFFNISKLPHLSSFFLSRYHGVPPQVSPDVLLQIGEMRNLRSLSVLGDWVDEELLIRISALRQLENLELKTGSLDEASLIQYLRNQSLRTLSLEWIDLTQKSIEVLSDMSSLQRISLLQSGLSDAQFNQLQKALPNCQLLR